MTGMMTPEGQAKAEAAYRESVARIEDQVEHCPACKAAKTRKRKADKAYAEANDAHGVAGMKNEMSRYHLAKANPAYGKIRRAAGKPDECQRHREARRLAYVCSPVSETYWTS